MSRTRRKKRCKQVITSAMVAGMAFTSALMPVMAAESAVAPVEADYGYYVDNYKKNDGNLGDPAFSLDNPSIGMLSEMLDYFTPASSNSTEGKTENDKWTKGTILNEKMHQLNLQKTYEIVTGASAAQQTNAYLVDRRDQNYSATYGLGIYRDAFVKGANVGTTIADEVPADASTKVYDDKGNSNGSWADTDQEYSGIVNLVNLGRNSAASTNQAKFFYNYMRPYRWSQMNSAYPQIQVISTLQPRISSTPWKDGGFSSGHTNASYIAALSMAYAVPEQYQQLLLNASELGNSRIVAGMHSCMDVVGGRMQATAVTASALYDSANVDAKAAAIVDGAKLTATAEKEEYTYEQYQADKAVYNERLTYGLLSGKSTTEPMVVPKGAEVLLESRLPYLDAEQRRYVLYTTGISSGYSVNDDQEGWGRLNLFEAASGYGAFVTDVTVNMDASKGGFSASDNWMNDIDGTGSLTKEGTGTLKLSGNNTYSGNTTVKDGSIVANSATAFGVGNVVNESSIVENTASAVELAGNYVQDDDAVLELTVSNAEDVLNIAGNAELNGTLVLNFDNYVPEEGFQAVNYTSASSQFKEVKINGLENQKVEYTENGIAVVSANSVNPSDVPNTGDSANVWALFTAMITAGLAGAGALFAKAFRRKEIR